jgi:Fe-S-cluster containining protein
VLARAHAAVALLAPQFPGDAETGALAEEGESWEAFADLPEADGACPVLDPATGRCELYSARPLTCRVFGPPVRNEGGIGVCELCYAGASEAEILAGEMLLEHQELEAKLNGELAAAGMAGETVIAWALLGH